MNSSEKARRIADRGDGVVLLLGGIDPGAGAGLLRDVLTAAVLGQRVHAVATAFTEQAGGRHIVEPRDPAALEDALRWAVGHLRPVAVKVGMLPGEAAAGAVLAALDGYGGPVVADPVLASSRGGRLWGAAPRDLLPLLRRATLVTPNAPEAQVLSGRVVRAPADAEAAAQALRAEGLRAVLVKGGHLGGAHDPVVDLLATGEGVRRFSRTREAGPSPRGTGCALATAIAVHLGRGTPLEEAVDAATTWLATAIRAATDAGGERHLGLERGPRARPAVR